MNIDQIKYIEAVVKEGSFRKASESLYISQPAISAAIKRVEEELNIEIFDKESYRAKLTHNGRFFYEKAKKVLEEFSNLEEYGKSLKKGIEPEIKIAIDAVFDISKILTKINTTIEKYRDTKLTVEVDYMENVADYLLYKDFDLIICPIDHIQHIVSDMEKVFIEQIKMYHVISPNCPILKSNTVITKEELKTLPQIIIRTGSENSFGVISDTRKWHVNDFYLKKLIIMEGIAYGMLPEHFIELELKNNKLIPLDKYEDFTVNNLNIYAFRNKNINHGIVAQEVWNTLTDLNLNEKLTEKESNHNV